MSKYRIIDRGEELEVVLYGDIGAGWFGEGIEAKQVKEDLAGLTPATIDVRINSPGGDVDQGIAIANILREHPARVTAHVDSLAASIASYIAVFGADEVVMASNARMMVHNAWTLAGGDANELRKVADILDMHNDILIDGYVAKTELSRGVVVEMLNAETWLNAEQAVDFGFADSVGESSLQMAAYFQPGRFRNAPADMKPTPSGTDPTPSDTWKAEAARRRLRLTRSGG